jgi:hypothetical protein
MPKSTKSLLPNHFGKLQLIINTPSKSDFQINRELKIEVLKLERSAFNQLKNLSLVAPRKNTIESILLYAAANDTLSKN